MKPRHLENLRKNIKDKDREIIRLLNERAQISVQIGKVKGEGGIEVYDPAQEAKVHGYLQELNSGPLPRDAVTAIFREIISASRSLQKPMNIAFLGPEASFSHLAARLHFGESSRYSPQTGIARVFDEVEKGFHGLGCCSRRKFPGRIGEHYSRPVDYDRTEYQGGDFSANQPVPNFFG